MRYNYKYVFFILGMISLASCSKENLDTNVTLEDEIVSEVVTCSIDVMLEEINSGELTSTVTNGTAPYTYSWSTGETSENIDTDIAGTYSLTVVDAEDCIAEFTIEISEDACNGLEIELALGPTSVYAYQQGGTAPFSLSWSNGETDVYGIDLDGSDEYEFTVTDDSGCTATATIDVTLPCPGFIPLPYYNSINGDVGSEIIGGVPPWSYEWNTGETTQRIDGPVDPGTYTVTITDANGCTEVESIIVP